MDPTPGDVFPARAVSVSSCSARASSGSDFTLPDLGEGLTEGNSDTGCTRHPGAADA